MDVLQVLKAFTLSETNSQKGRLSSTNFQGRTVPPPPPKLNSSPLKIMVRGRSFPIGKATFQGRAVKLREGSLLESSFLS